MWIHFRVVNCWWFGDARRIQRPAEGFREHRGIVGKTGTDATDYYMLVGEGGVIVP